MSDIDRQELVSLKEASQLKMDLNRGVALLKFATESWFQPHVCLNEKEGVAVIERIGENPMTADTAFFILNQPIMSGDDLWMNIHFRVFVDQMAYPDNVVNLTPRQTAYIVENLPPKSRALVLEKVKTWYLNTFRADLLKGLERITAQFESGDPLLKSDRENHIFDIHGGRVVGLDIPYTEGSIAGENLFSALFYGTCLDRDEHGYNRLDAILAHADRTRHDTAEGMIGLVRALNT